ncbi:Glutathione synthetase [Sorochytrium milnesiophthora]
MSLPSYPPALSALQYDALRDLATDWALSHGLVIRPAADASSAQPKRGVAVHAPLALFPSPFPRHCYDKAVALQPLFNSLVHKVAHNHAFLASIMDSLSLVDDFTGKLYNIYKAVQVEGVSQHVSLGIHRSDYLLHAHEDGTLGIKQVELNTIASSFGSLSELTSQLHRTDYYNRPDDTESLDIRANALAKSTSLQCIAEGIGKAHGLYNVHQSVVVMVVQPNERNAFDQRWLEYTLLDKHGVTLIRKTLADFHNDARLSTSTKTLHIATLGGEREVSVVYFRAGYGPDDYPSETEWSARLLIERSKAIKCPTVAYQLAGTKKVQQVLANVGVVEQFMSPSDAEQLRASFTGLYALDDTHDGQGATDMALAQPERFVLKPQREGGGNNLYGDELRQKLQQMTPSERNAYVLMDLIRPPPLRNVLIRNGEYMEAEVVSELGIYGIWISNGDQVNTNDVGGYLLRTKTSDTHEGGVAAGFAVLDSRARFATISPTPLVSPIDSPSTAVNPLTTPAPLTKSNPAGYSIVKEPFTPGALRLKSGHVFEGKTYGAAKNTTSGEVVFTTSLVGYPESLTDPSYAGQILVFTQPLIGNYGVPDAEVDQHGIPVNFESSKIYARGVICSAYTSQYSHRQAVMSLGQWCAHHNVPLLSGVDTRELVQVLRNQGSTLGQISADGGDANQAWFNPDKANLAEEVSVREPVVINSGQPVKIAVMDYGLKNNILRSLLAYNVEVTLLPYNYPVDEVYRQYDGIFLSNGPGNPARLGSSVEALRRVMLAEFAAIETRKKKRFIPIMGICMGNLLLGQAAGMRTYKLLYGNRGHNQPCLDMTKAGKAAGTGGANCVITSQNHGYALDDSAMPKGWHIYFTNANDGSNEGIVCENGVWRSVQFHPEAKGGPMDTHYLFQQFMDDVQVYHQSQQRKITPPRPLPDLHPHARLAEAAAL